MKCKDKKDRERESRVFLEKLCKDSYDPRELARDGKIEEGDFVWARQGFGWVFFLKPKNPRRKPRTIYDGEPKFVRLKGFRSQGLAGYLKGLAQRYGFSLDEIKTRSKKEQIWQFTSLQ